MSPNLIHQMSINSEESQSTKSTTILGNFTTTNSGFEKPDGKIKVRTLCLLGALLPGLGCYFVIAYTYLFQYDRVMNFSSSHCPNVSRYVNFMDI
uniref:Uncharacterized protein n=1 Tax=Panagrolaimus sp. JU765 TaxID=591449 RepID=A0AC34RLS9_9BILA